MEADLQIIHQSTSKQSIKPWFTPRFSTRDLLWVPPSRGCPARNLRNLDPLVEILSFFQRAELRVYLCTSSEERVYRVNKQDSLGEGRSRRTNRSGPAALPSQGQAPLQSPRISQHRPRWVGPSQGMLLNSSCSFPEQDSLHPTPKSIYEHSQIYP